MLTKTEDEIAFGKDVIVYCSQHMNPHFTGWCTVDIKDKIKLDSKNLQEAGYECKQKGYALYK